MGTKVLDRPIQKNKQKETDIEISQLKFHVGKKNKKQEPINRRVQNNKGYAMIQIPQGIMDRIGAILNAELYVEYSNINPLLSEIKIKLYNKKLSDEQLKQRRSQRKR